MFFVFINDHDHRFKQLSIIKRFKCSHFTTYLLAYMVSHAAYDYVYDSILACTYASYMFSQCNV